jgi:hypothetical protein
MQLCPVSIAVGCAKCPLVKVCPGKTIIGDAKKSKEQKNQDKE